MLKAAVKPPDVITLTRWGSPDARVLAGVLTKGPWQATASSAIKGNKVEIGGFSIDVFTPDFFWRILRIEIILDQWTVNDSVG
jgi:hypothetical protein